MRPSPGPQTWPAGNHSIVTTLSTQLTCPRRAARRELFPLPTFPQMPKTFPYQRNRKKTVILRVLRGSPPNCTGQARQGPVGHCWLCEVVVAASPPNTDTRPHRRQEPQSAQPSTAPRGLLEVMYKHRCRTALRCSGTHRP